MDGEYPHIMHFGALNIELTSHSDSNNSKGKSQRTIRN